MAGRHAPAAERFERHYVPEPNTGCWLWFGAQVPDGYGSFRLLPDVTVKAHRVAWTFFRGPIPDDKQVLHRCDVRCCVNPDHLFLGDNADNVADRVAKGRSGGARGPANANWGGGVSAMRGLIGIARGERIANAKLSARLVQQIRSAEGVQHQIARSFGVSQSLVSQVKLRKIWRHVD